MDHAMVFRRSPGMLCVLSWEGRLLDVSDGLAEVVGIPADALRGALLADLTHEADQSALDAALHRLAKGVPERALTLRLGRHDTGFRSLVWDLSPQPDAQLSTGCARDLREEQRALLRFKALADATSDYVGLATLEGERLYTNRAGMAMLGREEQDFRKVAVRELMPPEALERFRTVQMPAMLRDGRWSGEGEMLHASGRRIPMWLVNVILHDEAGKPEAMGLIARELTAQKRAEADLRRFRILADVAPDYIGIATLDERLTYLNPAGLALVGREGQDPTTLTIRDFAMEADIEEFMGVGYPQLMASGTYTQEISFRHVNGGTVPVLQSLVLIRDAAGQPEAVATLARDMTSQKQLELALRRSLQEMETPIIQVWDGVLALPVIGLVDSARAAQMMESLLAAISATSCRVTVLDLTGVGTIDTSTVNHLFRMIDAAALLGSLCVVSGVSGGVAQVVSHLGLDVSRLKTFRTLRDALRFAVRHAGASGAEAEAISGAAPNPPFRR